MVLGMTTAQGHCSARALNEICAGMGSVCRHCSEQTPWRLQSLLHTPSVAEASALPASQAVHTVL